MYQQWADSSDGREMVPALVSPNNVPYRFSLAQMSGSLEVARDSKTLFMRIPSVVYSMCPVFLGVLTAAFYSGTPELQHSRQHLGKKMLGDDL